MDDFESDIESTEGTARSTAAKIGMALGAAGAAGAGLLAAGFAANANLEVGNDKLAAQLGLTTQDAGKAGAAAAEVYGNNWGENMDEVNAAIRSVGTNIGDVSKMSEDQLAGITEKALALSSTMDVDLALSTEAVGAMMKNGLAKNADEAFDILTAGMQGGVNKADDLLETFQEYSPQFSKLGIDGKDALNLLSAGLKAGARDTDVLADGFKEFGLRVLDGSETTNQAFKDIGLDAKGMAEAFGKGGDSAREATDQVIEGLLGIKDPLKQNEAGTALFGTTWEDTIRTVLPALQDTKGEIENVDGATQRMADTVGDNAAGKIETLKRGFEQWTQSMASSDGALGLAITGVGEFGGTALAGASQAGILAMSIRGTAAAEKAAAAATFVLNGALKALRFAWLAALGPVGLIIAAIALVAAGLVLAYKKSETFRAVTRTVFKAVANTVATLVDHWLKGFQTMFEVMGKLPGKAGAPFRKAAAAVQGMRNKVNSLRADINRLKGKEIEILVRKEYITSYRSELRRDENTARRGAGGGIGRGANAVGGPQVAGGAYMVGEHGPEISMPATNRMILPAGLTQRLGQTGGGNTYEIHVHGNVLASKKELRALILDALASAPAGSGGGGGGGGSAASRKVADMARNAATRAGRNAAISDRVGDLARAAAPTQRWTHAK